MKAEDTQIAGIDIDELREPQIKAHGLTRADNIYTFYYDETNNIRKLRLESRGFNVADLKVFVLGGIAHEGISQSIDLEPLRHILRVQPTAKEIKLEHVAKGEFLDLLKSNKLAKFLEWVQQSGFIVHYHDLDPFYWSIADIVDSVLLGIEAPELFVLHTPLKADLAEALKNDVSATAQLFHTFNYPGLAPENRRPFLDGVIDVVERNTDVLSPFGANILLQILRAGRNLKSLEFIEGFAPRTLIDDFSIFYLGRLATFKYSQHILDAEDLIRKRINQTPLTSKGQPVTHYRFADSKSEPGIQVADVLVGLIGKMHSYFRETSKTDVLAARSALDVQQIKNAELLRDLIDASHAANIAFLHHVASIHDIEKLDAFLRLSGGDYDR